LNGDVLLVELRHELLAEQAEAQHRRREDADAACNERHRPGDGLSQHGAYFSLNQRIGFTSVSLTLPLITIAIIAGTKVSDSTKAGERHHQRDRHRREGLALDALEGEQGTKTRKMMSWP
jgi:hypothetical protein